MLFYYFTQITSIERKRVVDNADDYSLNVMVVIQLTYNTEEGFRTEDYLV